MPKVSAEETVREKAMGVCSDEAAGETGVLHFFAVLIRRLEDFFSGWEMEFNEF